MQTVPSDKRKPDRRPVTPENCDENKEYILMNKRLLSLLLALAMVLALTACGGKKEEEKEPEKPQVEEPADLPAEEEEPADEAQPEETEPVQPEEERAEEPEAEKPAEPTQKPESKPVEKPAQKPAAPAEKPVEKPAEKPAESKSVDLAAFYESVFSGGNMPAMMQAEGEVLDAFYPGLTAIQTNQCAVYTAMISAAVGEMALVEVQNSADVQAVKDIFQARINYQVGDDQNPGGAWYPASIEGWKNGSRIVSNGNYVMLIALSEGADDVVNSFNALFA